MAKVIEELGLAINNNHFKLIKKEGNKDDLIAKHNHPGFDILFTVVKGKVQVTINEIEMFILVPGQVLSFDGKDSIFAKLLDESSIFITLIKQ